MPRRTAVFLTVTVALILSVISIFLVYSASRRNYGASLAIRQSIWLLIGIVSAFVIARLSRKQLFESHWFLYSGGVVLLAVTLFLGVEVRGDRSWLDLGLFHIQTSELMKPLLLISMAVVSEKISSGYRSLSVGLLQLTVLVMIPTGLILLQPDFGTALVYLGIYVIWLAIMGLNRETLTLIAAGGAASGGMILAVSHGMPAADWLGLLQHWMVTHRTVSWLLIAALVLLPGVLPYVFKSRVTFLGSFFVASGAFLGGLQLVPHLAEYQQERLRVFLNPYQAPLKSGYNVIQSQIAIGSGGWFGQGYLQGSQSQLGFIPELWTDFIFSVAIEELGLLFGLVFLGLLTLLVYSVFSTAALADDWKGYYLTAGVGIIWVVHALINLGVCVGLLPVIGLPLPFTSYGGSFLITNWLMIGLIVCANSGVRGTTTFK